MWAGFDAYKQKDAKIISSMPLLRSVIFNLPFLRFRNPGISKGYFQKKKNPKTRKFQGFEVFDIIFSRTVEPVLLF
jgi:hypothetical protein